MWGPPVLVNNRTAIVLTNLPHESSFPISPPTYHSLVGPHHAQLGRQFGQQPSNYKLGSSRSHTAWQSSPGHCPTCPQRLPSRPPCPAPSGR